METSCTKSKTRKIIKILKTFNYLTISLDKER
jgi:hypothetical protein